MTASPHDDTLRDLIQGRLPQAAARVHAMLSDNGHDHRAWFLKGRLAALQGRYDEEFACTQKAVALEPDWAEYWAQLGKSYARMQKLDEAMACVEKALASRGVNDLALDAVAAIHTRFGFHAQAAQVLKRAVADGTRNAAIWFNLGSSLKFCGDFSGARQAYESSIALAPSYAKAHAALSSLGGVSESDNHIDRLEGLIAQCVHPMEKLHLSHAAAREYEALKHYDRAFDALRVAKAGVLKAEPYDPAEDRAVFDALLSAFETPRDVIGHSGAQPLFITGMPRSGTTVLDRILSNHSQVASIGETLHFPMALKQRAEAQTRRIIDAETVQAMAGAEDLSEVGRTYMARASALSEGARFVDKFHLNIWVAGFIARALPDARILCLVRDPLDTIVSNYRQLFELNTPTYRYTLSLADTARFYVGFRQLADLWARQLPQQFRIVPYEQLVTDPESHARKVLEFCGLDWEDGCIRIEDNSSAVATASAVQVRQPINARSVGNWRRYEAHLDEARAILEAAGFTT